MDALDVIEKIFGMYTLIITILGSLLNPLILFVCLRKKLRSVNAFKFFAAMSIADTIALYEWNLKHFTNIYYNINYEDHSIVWCRLSMLLQYVSLEYSAWMLVNKKKKIQIRKNCSNSSNKKKMYAIFLCVN